MLMAYEATSDLALEPVSVETPLERMTAQRVSGKKLTLVPILRAGLGMVDGVLRLVPSARVGHIGLYRDHQTLEPVDYYFRVPGDAAERQFFVLDPMLATGGSAVAAVDSLKRAGATRIRFLCLVAAPAGVQRMAGRASRRQDLRRRTRSRAQRPRIHSPRARRRGRPASSARAPAPDRR